MTTFWTAQILVWVLLLAGWFGGLSFGPQMVCFALATVTALVCLIGRVRATDRRADS